MYIKIVYKIKLSFPVIKKTTAERIGKKPKFGISN